MRASVSWDKFGGNLGQLHQGKSTFHHTCATRFTNDHQGCFMLQAIIHGAGNTFTHYRTQGTADEFKIHTTHHHMVLPNHSGSNADGICNICFLPGFFQSFLVRFQIGKMKKILGTDILKEHIVFIVVEQDFEIFVTADAVMMTVFGAYE